jgi:hypothetical protein
MEYYVGELFLHVEFVVTNLTLRSRAAVRFYNKRRTGGQWIKEGKQGDGEVSEKSCWKRVKVPLTPFRRRPPGCRRARWPVDCKIVVANEVVGVHTAVVRMPNLGSAGRFQGKLLIPGMRATGEEALS